MDLLGSLADFPSNPLAIMPAASADVTGAFETDYHMNSGAGTSQTSNQVNFDGLKVPSFTLEYYRSARSDQIDIYSSFYTFSVICCN